MSTATEQLRSRIREILVKDPALTNAASMLIQERLLNLINQDKLDCLVRYEEMEESAREDKETPFFRMEQRLTRQFLWIAAVQLIALAVAVFLLAG